MWYRFVFEDYKVTQAESLDEAIQKFKTKGPVVVQITRIDQRENEIDDWIPVDNPMRGEYVP